MFAVYVALYCVTLLHLQTLAENILDKFYQSDYKIKFEHVDVVSFDKTTFKQLKIVTFKHNRTCTAVNATFELNIDMGYDLDVVTQAYKFASNEYRHFPMRFQVNSCDALSKNIAGIAAFFNCGNYTGCPFSKGRLELICNWTLDNNKLPPLMLDGRYMLEMQLIYSRREIALLECYLEVYRPITIPT